MRRRLRAGAVAAAAILALSAILGLGLALAPAAGATPGPAQAPEWWFDTWNVPQLWAEGADGHGVTVAVVDTGVQADIPELSGRVLAGADYLGNGSDGRTDYDGSSFSHGTAMASIIASGPSASTGIEGLAPQAKILPIAVPLRGVITTGTPVPDATPKAIRYAVDHGAKIVSMSLGGMRNEATTSVPCPSSLQDAVVYALSKGALVIAASGNSGDDGSPVEEPGVCLGVVSVGSVNGELQVSSFSSRHPYLTLTAPGERIPSLTRQSGVGYVGSGTSQATALASAAIALVWSKYPSESNEQILDRVLSTTSDRGPAGRDSAYGIGFIEPGAAARAPAPAAGTTDPVFAGVRPLLDLAKVSATSSVAKVAPAGDASAPLGVRQVGSRQSTVGVSVVVLAVASGLFAIATVLLTVAALRPGRRRPPAEPATPATFSGGS